ncbi:MAG: autoinducer binding domain-containing protein [Candidatus Competibacteraceae bacterium]|nr:autoinducer binding domain-containing protein [Candidatus Competibacteraceae bacterium]
MDRADYSAIRHSGTSEHSVRSSPRTAGPVVAVEIGQIARNWRWPDPVIAAAGQRERLANWRYSLAASSQRASTDCAARHGLHQGVAFPRRRCARSPRPADRRPGECRQCRIGTGHYKDRLVALDGGLGAPRVGD